MFTIIENYKTLMKMCVSASLGGPESSSSVPEATLASEVSEVRGVTAEALKDYQAATEYLAQPQAVIMAGAPVDVVKDVQEMFVHAGYDIGDFGPNKNGVDGDFGGTMVRTVRAFQEANGLTVDGMIGNQTYTALIQAAIGGSYTTSVASARAEFTLDTQEAANGNTEMVDIGSEKISLNEYFTRYGVYPGGAATLEEYRGESTTMSAVDMGVTATAPMNSGGNVLVAAELQGNHIDHFDAAYGRIDENTTAAMLGQYIPYLASSGWNGELVGKNLDDNSTISVAEHMVAGINRAYASYGLNIGLAEFNSVFDKKKQTTVRGAGLEGVDLYNTSVVAGDLQDTRISTLDASETIYILDFNGQEVFLRANCANVVVPVAGQPAPAPTPVYEAPAQPYTPPVPTPSQPVEIYSPPVEQPIEKCLSYTELLNGRYTLSTPTSKYYEKVILNPTPTEITAAGTRAIEYRVKVGVPSGAGKGLPTNYDPSTVAGSQEDYYSVPALSILKPGVSHGGVVNSTSEGARSEGISYIDTNNNGMQDSAETLKAHAGCGDFSIRLPDLMTPSKPGDTGGENPTGGGGRNSVGSRTGGVQGHSAPDSAPAPDKGVGEE